jgi:hypothetical protein
MRLLFFTLIFAHLAWGQFGQGGGLGDLLGGVLGGQVTFDYENFDV